MNIIGKIEKDVKNTSINDLIRLQKEVERGIEKKMDWTVTKEFDTHYLINEHSIEFYINFDIEHNSIDFEKYNEMIYHVLKTMDKLFKNWFSQIECDYDTFKEFSYSIDF